MVVYLAAMTAFWLVDRRVDSLVAMTAEKTVACLVEVMVDKLVVSWEMLKVGMWEGK